MYKKILIICVVTSVAACSPKKNAQKSPVTGEAAKTAGTKPGISGKVKGHTKMDGLFTIYRDTSTGSAYMAINKDQLGKEFIYFSYTENGVVQTGHNRGSYRDNKIFTVRRNYDRIEFVVKNTRFYFDPENALSKSSDANISDAILVSEEIVAKDNDSVFLVNADKVFLNENLARIKPFVPQIPGIFSLGTLSTSKTKYHEIRNYPANTDILVEYVYDNPAAFSGAGEITDPRTVSIIYQHSFIEVPENGFQPRRDDSRIGYFMQQTNDMTSYSATPYKDVINRWHLVKKDPAAALSEPVEPITWWIEKTTPVEFRETIREAGLAWNKAFEKAGFKNAIKMEIQPDTAQWEAGDIRYNVLRWTSSPNPPFGGYGPSFVNPRTGQIMGADIMLEFIFITGRLNQEKYFNTAALQQEEEHSLLSCNGDDQHYCAAGKHLQHTLQVGMASLAATDASKTEIQEFLKSAIYYLVLHEMGHTMGLMHNMRASQLWLPAEINDLQKTSTIGLVGSVMDYPTLNISLDKSKQGQYYTTTPGPYDLWAIEYGYSPALPDPVQEEARLEGILSRSTEKELAFGNDADDMRSPGKGIDPRVMIFDISGDAITYSGERLQLVNILMEKIKAKYTVPGNSYQELRNSYLFLTGEIGNATGVISRYIGGVYVERSVAGQPNAKQPYTPVAYADQKRAMVLLEKNLFAPDAFKAPEGLYNYLQQQRRGFNFFSSTEDPKIHERVLNIQKGALVHILHPQTMQRITDSRLYGNTYTVTEMMTDLENAVFKADMSSNVNTLRQNLQSEFTELLIQVAGLGEKPVHDNISKNAAFGSLLSIQTQLKQNQNKGDLSTQAHRKRLIFLIEKAMQK